MYFLLLFDQFIFIFMDFLMQFYLSIFGLCHSLVLLAAKVIRFHPTEHLGQAITYGLRTGVKFDHHILDYLFLVERGLKLKKKGLHCWLLQSLGLYGILQVF